MRLFRVHFNYISLFLDYFYNGSEFMHDPDVLDNEKKKYQEAGIYFLVMYFHSFENFYLQIGSNNGLSVKGVEGFSLSFSQRIDVDVETPYRRGDPYHKDIPKPRLFTNEV